MAENKEYEVCLSFDAMNLKEPLLRGIYAYGYEKPSQIQQRAIVPLATGKDLIAQAQSGTGKTATFTVGVLQQIDTSKNVCQALILAPTRELANQIETVVLAIGDYLGVKCRAFIGGQSLRDDIEALKNGVHVAIGTPGRIYELLQKRNLLSDNIKVLILDEADEMLSAGFKDQIYDIHQTLPLNLQVGLFSATMPAVALDITTKFMKNPTHILLQKEELTLDGIKQFYIDMEPKDKLDVLCDIYESASIAQCIIFCNSVKTAEWLTETLKERDFVVTVTHGKMPFKERDARLKEFRTGASRLLVSTDLLGRGIDVQQVSLVINFDIPNKMESYIHRIGRSGRFGRKGVAINFKTKYDTQMIRDLERFYNTQITPLPENFAQLIK